MENKNKFQDELNFKDLLKNPLRLFGYSYFYFLIIIFGIGIYYINNLPNIERNLTKPTLDSVIVEKDIPFQKGYVLPPLDVLKASKSNTERITNGKSLYSANCASCHGEGGLGDGPTAATLNPKPRNFTSNDKWTNGRKFTDIYKTLEEGITANGMPSFNYLTPEERFNIIHYLNTLMKDIPSVTDDEFLTLDKNYNLSKGIVKPPQIPVKVAQEIIIKENQSFNNKINEIVDIVNKGDKDKFSVLIRNTYDLRKALFTSFQLFNKQSSKEEFFNFLKFEVNKNGFSAGIFRLDSEGMDKLYALLNELYKISQISNQPKQG